MPPPKKQKDEIPPPQSSPSLKRSLAPKATSSPAKKQTKWSTEEDTRIIKLRGEGLKWDDISKQLPGRSAVSCRLHYQNYLERRSEWDEEKKDRLARLYERFKPEMWAIIAKELEIPWRAVEAMHWQLGEQDMAKRAGVVPFSLSSVAIDISEGTTTTPGSARRRSASPGSSSAIAPVPALAEHDHASDFGRSAK